MLTGVRDMAGGLTTKALVPAVGDLVGFYTDSAGNTDGMLALP
jgi:hypothetical protein